MAEHQAATRPLEGRVAVITGGARGMGQAIVRGFLAAGCRVAALDRSWESTGLSHDNVQEFKGELDRNQALALSVDLADEAQIQAAFNRTLADLGSVDILINNAGMRMREVHPSTYSPILETEMDYWRRMFDVNVLAPVRLIQRFAPIMIAKRSGSIINVSSNSGANGRAGDNPYGASKAALTNLSQSLARELTPQNVAVNVIFPAGTQTTGYDEQRRLRQERLGAQPGRVFRPDSIVPLALWLAEQDATITGQIFSVTDWLPEHGYGPLESWLAPAPG
jgi:NAD(P)-dependent dehydrogenase (short-subunit alcohol dehydrogenase family)